MTYLFMGIAVAVVMTVLGYLYARKSEAEKALQTETERSAKQLEETKRNYEAHEGQLAMLRKMNEEQVKSQLDLIREQMQTTSERVLKIRQEELTKNRYRRLSTPYRRV